MANPLSPLDPGSAEGPLLVFGGTFDPIHFGHLRAAEEVRQMLQAEQVLLVPAGDPPHRSPPRTSGAHRLAMVQSAVAAERGFTVLDWEVRSQGPSYSVKTLGWLRERFGSWSIVFIMGSDAFEQLHTWYQWQRLLELAHIAVVQRPGTPLDPLVPSLGQALRGRWAETAAELGQSPGGRVVVFEITRLDISATAIRSLVSRGHSPRFLLPQAVEDYIGEHELYQDESEE